MSARMVFGRWLLLLLVHSWPAAAQSFVGAPFPIATGWVAAGSAFDGSNHLVAMESGSHLANVAGQLIASTGAKVGPLIPLGRVGHTCCSAVAFDGTNYLMVWEDEEPGAATFTAFGQFISKAGVVLGQPFAIAAGIWLDGARFLSYGGGSYLITYVRLIDPANGDRFDNRYIAGRIISPSGAIGDELRVSTGFGARSSVGFNGTDFFVVWVEDSLDHEVRGRFVGSAGALLQEFSIYAGAHPSDNILGVAFDGTDYLVVFHEEVGATQTSETQEWNVIGRRVSSSGAIVGDPITIANDPGPQLALGAAFDGTNYLVAWTDLQASTNWVYGRYIGKDGSYVGDRFVIDSNAGNQFGGVAGYANGNYLAFISRGVQIGAEGLTLSGAAAYGLLVGAYQPPAPLDPDAEVALPPATQAAYAVSSGQLSEIAVSVDVSGTYRHANLQVTLDVEKAISAAFAASPAYNVYVVALVPGSLLGSAAPLFFVKPKSGVWGPLKFPILAFLENAAENSVENQVVIQILSDTDISALQGTEVYIGYGTSSDEMLSAGRYRGVYKVQ